MLAAATPLEDFVLRVGAVCGALVVVAGFVAAVARYSTKKFTGSVREIVAESLSPIESRTMQLIPNGGSSLADAVRRIDAAQVHIRAEQAALRTALESHLAQHRALPYSE